MEKRRREMKKVFFSFLFLFLIYGSPSWAEPEITETTMYYDIHGTTIEQLRSEMHHKSGHSDGLAYTNWTITCRADKVKTSQGYVVAKSNTKLILTYHYPRWTDEAQAPEELRQKWAAFVKALEIHERGHGAIAMEAARAVDQAVMAVKPNKDAHILDGFVKIAGDKTIAVFRKKEIEYDQSTKYGQNQGATF
jgi:predicted secreted Zn-dependent protease